MSRGRDINKPATEPKEKVKQGIYSWYFISGFAGTLYYKFWHGVPLKTVEIEITLSVEKWSLFGEKKIGLGRS